MDEKEIARTLKTRARALRRESIDAERLLWSHLRGRRMAGFKFRRQFVIAPYVVDFACAEARLIVEADGGQHAEREQADRLRTAFLEQRGYTVLRFWNHEILSSSEAVLEVIQQFLNEAPSAPPGITPRRDRGAQDAIPSPRPSPQRGEGAQRRRAHLPIRSSPLPMGLCPKG